MISPIIKSSHYSLKPYNPENEDRFIEICLDLESIKFMGNSTGNEVEERKMFKKIFEIYDRNDERWFWIWGIFRNDLLCGHLELKETENTNDTELEIVYMIHPCERKKGIMTEVFSLLKQNQSTWNKRIVTTVSPDNINSISLMKKWGIDRKEILINNETNEEYFKIILAEK